MPKLRKNKLDVLEYRPGQGGTTELYDIKVMTQRGQGIGTSLVQELEALVGPKIYGFTRKENSQARAFYQKNGFSELVLEGFYPDGDGVIIWKK
jgi:ribosomal protein S18 acetylase RimI-like enzyme